MGDPAPTIHASAVLVGATAILIRGPSGSGKSSLALGLLQAAERSELAFARLVADDRCHVAAVNGRLLVRPAPELAGLIEVRGLGIRRVPYEPVALATMAVDLADNAPRMPGPSEQSADVCGVRIPLLVLGPQPLPVLLAALSTVPSGI